MKLINRPVCREDSSASEISMERNRQTRIPVHLNAVLIGKHTVPKGCRVRNVSEQGMMLNCEPDGRILTFRYDDRVDIHLLFQDTEGCRYLTKTANVRHVNENSIGVEFQHPDSGLVELLKACKVVEHHDSGKPAANDHEIYGTDPAGDDRKPADPHSSAAKHMNRYPEPPRNRDRRPFYSGILVLLAAVCIGLIAYTRTSAFDTRLGRLETLVNTHSNELEIIKVAPVATGTLDSSIADLRLRMERLAESFAALEQKLSPAAGHPPGLTGTGAAYPDHTTVSSAGSGAATDAALTVTTASILEAPAAAPAGSENTADPVSGTEGSTGPWVINLISSRDQAATARFLDKARSLDIPAQQTTADINGRTYSRLQVGGFSSAAEARSASAGIKEKLGLKDVWIFRRE
jgi:hypothetical protein